MVIEIAGSSTFISGSTINGVSSLVVIGNRVQRTSALLPADSLLTVIGRKLWEDEPDDTDTWTLIPSDTDIWTPLAASGGNWVPASPDTDIWTPVPNSGGNWQQAA